MDDTLFTLLRRVDTPTVCNAIEVAQGKRGFAGFTRSQVFPSHPTAPAMVGYARTARIRASAPPVEDAATIRARRMEYYRYMAEAPSPSVVVIEDADPHPVGAYWGELNATVHKAFGLQGVLTNGLIRDLGDLPPEFPMLGGSTGPSHGFVHVLDFHQPVNVLGLRVSPGDLIHADRHGAVAVPAEVIPVLADCIGTLMATERIVLDAARAPGFDFAAFEDAWTRFEAART